MSYGRKNHAVLEAEAKGELAYDERHDSYYNTRTKEWLEPACENSDCPFCWDRPQIYGEKVKEIK